MAAQIESTQMGNGQLIDYPGTTIEQAHAAADIVAERLQGLMVQLVRQGLDASLRSVQVWADLARQLGAIPPDSPVAATMVSLGYDLFEKLLMGQREVVNQLVDNQRQFAQRFFGTTTVGGGLTRR